jgi:hypothetical protein
MSYWDWAHIGPTTDINPGIGYTQKGTGNTGAEQQYTFEGKPNNGTIILAADDVDGDSANESERGLTLTTTLIGNPYPSAIDAQKFIADNATVVTGTLQLWEQWAGNSHYLQDYQGGYAYINSFTTVRAYQHPDITIVGQGQSEGFKVPTFYIPVGQAFFAEVIEDGNIEFNNSQRIFIKESDSDGSSVNGSAFLRPSPNNSIDEETNYDYKNRDFQLIKFEFATSAGGSRRFVLGFSEKATDSLNLRYDGGLIDESFDDDMGSLLNDKQYVIQALSPFHSDKVVDLILNASGNYGYSLKTVEIKNIPEEQELYLLDNLTNTYYDLRNEEAYNFTSEPGQFKERFDVVFRNATSNSDNESYSVNEPEIVEEELIGNTIIYLNQLEKLLYVKFLETETAQLTITNILGQRVMSYNSIKKDKLENGVSISGLSSGVYIISLQSENNQNIDKKVIIN